MAHNDTDKPLVNELSPVLISLLKGVVYQDGNPELWDALLRLQSRVREYFGAIGLELMLDESEGYAYLRSRPDDDPESKLPRLIPRHQLSYPVSLLLALIRRKLAEFDASGNDTRLVMSREEIVELVRVFLPEGSNEAKLVDQVDTHLGRIVDLGFLRRLKNPSGQGQSYEVRRILKAFIDGNALSAMDERLAAYRTTGLKGKGGGSDG